MSRKKKDNAAQSTRQLMGIDGIKDYCIATRMPDKPGLAVWHDGHIGVYIGDGYVIEAMGTKYGVVKTELAGRGWTHWLEIEYINYD